MKESWKRQKRTNILLLVRRQRGDSQEETSCINFEFDEEALNPVVDNWAKYFHDLATPAEMPHFDAWYKRHMYTKRLLLQDLNSETTGDPLHLSRVKEHIHHLKNNKAADAYGITAEHLKYAGDPTQEAIANLINRIKKDQNIPITLKLGSITPLHKKKKTKTNPNHYIIITIKPMLGKLL